MSEIRFMPGDVLDEAREATGEALERTTPGAVESVLARYREAGVGKRGPLKATLRKMIREDLAVAHVILRGAVASIAARLQALEADPNHLDVLPQYASLAEDLRRLYDTWGKYGLGTQVDVDAVHEHRHVVLLPTLATDDGEAVDVDYEVET